MTELAGPAARASSATPTSCPASRATSATVTGRFGGPATTVARPGSVAEVAAVLARAARPEPASCRRAATPGLVGGGVPRGGEVVLSLARLTEIGPLDPVARQITAGAGVTPAALAAALRGSGLALGVDFGARDAATLGGMVATDAGGAQVLRHGTMRARVAGLEAVLADGARAAPALGAAEGQRRLRPAAAARGLRGNARRDHGGAARAGRRAASDSSRRCSACRRSARRSSSSPAPGERFPASRRRRSSTTPAWSS